MKIKKYFYNNQFGGFIVKNPNEYIKSIEQAFHLWFKNFSFKIDDQCELSLSEKKIMNLYIKLSNNLTSITPQPT